MSNTKYTKTQDMIDKLQNLIGKTKLKFQQNISIFFVAIGYRRQSGTFQFQKKSFSERCKRC